MSPSPKPSTNGQRTQKRSRKSQASAVPLPTKHNDHKLRDPKAIETRRRLGITPQQMQNVPRISHLLSHAEGGIETCIGALRMSDDPDAGRFLEKYDSISATDRGRVSLEEISVSAGVSTKSLLAAILVAIDNMGASAARIARASFSAPVIRATAEAAINGKNATANRKLFLSGIGFLPVPVNKVNPGLVVNVTNQNAVAAQALHEAQEAPSQPVIEGEVANYMSTENQLQNLHADVEEQKMLEAPSSEPAEISDVFRDDLECIPTQSS